MTLMTSVSKELRKEFDDDRRAIGEPFLVQTLDPLGAWAIRPMHPVLHPVETINSSRVNLLGLFALSGIGDLPCNSLKAPIADAELYSWVRFEVEKPRRSRPSEGYEINGVAVSDRTDALTSLLAALSPSRGQHAEPLRWPQSEPRELRRAEYSTARGRGRKWILAVSLEVLLALFLSHVKIMPPSLFGSTPS